MTLSIRAKLTLSLLLISLCSAALVGGVAYLRLMRKFDDLVLQDASENFRHDVIAWHRAYGSFEEARRQEDFRAFSERRRSARGLPLRSGPDIPEQRPDPQLTPLAPLAHDAPSTSPGAADLQRPPFLFYLFDTQRRAVLPLAPYVVGDAMDARRHETVLPIQSEGEVLAWFSPEGQVNYSDLDLGYLSAMRDALLIGTSVAAVLTLLLGLAFGSRLSAALRRLTAAVRAVEGGDLQQRVVVESRDEVGELAQAFNRMGAELARSHHALQQANDQVRRQAARLEELSVRDGLTGLHNRRFFDQQAREVFLRCVHSGRPLAVMLGDLDFFKSVNDRLSHGTGDRVLREVSGILRRRVRGADVVARYGGEEFAIVFPDTTLQQAHGVCEDLRRLIEVHPWHELHPELKVTMSMGVCAGTTESIDAMLARADDLLYQAKSSGRNRVCSAGEGAAGATPS